MPPSPATLDLICGPMFAGKTSLLLARIAAARPLRPVVCVRPAFDTRSAQGAIQSHTGAAHPALVIEHPGDLLRLAPPAGGLLALDELHFMGDAAIAPVRALLRQGVSVLAAGIERDHRGDPFPPFPALLCEADTVTKLTGTCCRCGGPSLHSYRTIPTDSPLAVGGAESYEPRCRRCFELVHAAPPPTLPPR